MRNLVHTGKSPLTCIEIKLPPGSRSGLEFPLGLLRTSPGCLSNVFFNAEKAGVVIGFLMRRRRAYTVLIGTQLTTPCIKKLKKASIRITIYNMRGKPGNEVPGSVRSQIANRAAY